MTSKNGSGSTTQEILFDRDGGSVARDQVRGMVDSMPRKPKPQADDPEESRRFINMAREIGADESPVAFEHAFNPQAGEGQGGGARNRLSTRSSWSRLA
jgi:hypothetical protein